jgi:hypothetical protein
MTFSVFIVISVLRTNSTYRMKLRIESRDDSQFRQVQASELFSCLNGPHKPHRGCNRERRSSLTTGEQKVGWSGRGLKHLQS